MHFNSREWSEAVVYPSSALFFWLNVFIPRHRYCPIAPQLPKYQYLLRYSVQLWTKMNRRRCSFATNDTSKHQEYGLVTNNRIKHNLPLVNIFADLFISFFLKNLSLYILL